MATRRRNRAELLEAVKDYESMVKYYDWCQERWCAEKDPEYLAMLDGLDDDALRARFFALAEEFADLMQHRNGEELYNVNVSSHSARERWIPAKRVTHALTLAMGSSASKPPQPPVYEDDRASLIAGEKAQLEAAEMGAVQPAPYFGVTGKPIPSTSTVKHREKTPVYCENEAFKPPEEPPRGKTAPEFAALWRIVDGDPARVLNELGVEVPTVQGWFCRPRRMSKSKLAKRAKIELTLAAPNLGYVTEWLTQMKAAATQMMGAERNDVAPGGNGTAAAIANIHCTPLDALFATRAM